MRIQLVPVAASIYQLQAKQANNKQSLSYQND